MMGIAATEQQSSGCSHVLFPGGEVKSARLVAARPAEIDKSCLRADRSRRQDVAGSRDIGFGSVLLTSSYSRGFRKMRAQKSSHRRWTSQSMPCVVESYSATQAPGYPGAFTSERQSSLQRPVACGPRGSIYAAGCACVEKYRDDDSCAISHSTPSHCHRLICVSSASSITGLGEGYMHVGDDANRCLEDLGAE